MIRVLALIKDDKQLIGLRLLDEVSGATGDYSIIEAARFMEAYGCSNVIMKQGYELECTECSIDRFPVYNRDRKLVKEGGSFILSKLILHGDTFYNVTDHSGRVVRVIEKALICDLQTNKGKVVNAKLRKVGDKVIISAIKGSFKEIKANEEDCKLPKDKKGSKEIYTFTTGYKLYSVPNSKGAKVYMTSENGATAGVGHDGIHFEWLSHNIIRKQVFKSRIKLIINNIYEDTEKADKVIDKIKTDEDLRKVLKESDIYTKNQVELMIKGYTVVYDEFNHNGKKYVCVEAGTTKDKWGKLGLIEYNEKENKVETLLPCMFDWTMGSLIVKVDGIVEVGITIKNSNTGKYEGVYGYYNVDTHRCTRIAYQPTLEVSDGLKNIFTGEIITPEQLRKMLE